jgi:hypothetical protein
MYLLYYFIYSLKYEYFRLIILKGNCVKLIVTLHNSYEIIIFCIGNIHKSKIKINIINYYRN